jgi:hypothetical protein
VNIARTTSLTLEIVALAATIAAAWWLGGVATDAWLLRVAELGVAAPEAATVRGAARSACMQLSAGLAALIVARVISARRSGPATVAVPWLLPALAVALLLGHAFHLATVEVVRGTALAPTAAGYAQGVLIGCVAGAAILVAPIASPGFAGARSTTEGGAECRSTGTTAARMARAGWDRRRARPARRRSAARRVARTGAVPRARRHGASPPARG